MTLPPAGNIRTSQRQRIRSLPPSHRSAHLERHLLSKEKERLEKEIALLEQRLRYRRQHLADVEARMRLPADRGRDQPPAATAPGPAGARPQMMRMTVEY